MSKLVVIVQCELVTRRCSGYNCMKAFTQRSGKMKGYPEDTRYMAVNCGGCCGAGIDVKIENLEKRFICLPVFARRTITVCPVRLRII